MNTFRQTVIVRILRAKPWTGILVFKDLLILQFEFINLEDQILHLRLQLLVF